MRGKDIRSHLLRSVALGAALVAPYLPTSASVSSITLTPATMARVATIEERFQSYNIEMVEVTGGRFWRPYRDGVPPLFAYRKPIDLTNARLRKLAAALGPAYVRVSGTWANATWFNDGSGRAKVPAGFTDELTRKQWKGVIDFARTVDARLVTSFATSKGTRNAHGAWTPAQADKLIAYTNALGGEIAAAEFTNEPSGDDAANFGRDLAIFRSWLKQASPKILLLGPGVTSGDGAYDVRAGENLLGTSGPVFDAISWHYYAEASRRCSHETKSAAGREQYALSESRLSKTDRVERIYADLRDRFEPGKPLWITETAAAYCGGNPWDATFLDSFRYLDQLGRMARHGVQVVMHNTLAASDYGLLDERTFAPRPDYWAALLWRRLMGTTVLDPGGASAPGLYLYAHCLREKPGGVALLAINTDRAAPATLELPTTANRYALTAEHLTDASVRLNGSELRLGAQDELPPLESKPVLPGRLDLAPASITFLAIPDAANPACE
jgi:heparanase 1